MIVLLTGRPGIGKSTVIEKLIPLLHESARWVVTSSIPRPELGDRGGFAATNSEGVRRVISHKTDIQSDVIVGENRVDLAAVDAMFADALDGAAKPGGPLTIVDEIGPIQLLSPKFAAALKHAFSGKTDLIATIHRTDKRLESYRRATHVFLIEVTLDNRDMMPDVLAVLAKNRTPINRLSHKQQAVFRDLFRKYTDLAMKTQLHKLTVNAIEYIDKAKITPIDNNFVVQGNHGRYTVRFSDRSYSCECDLFNGRNRYADKAGDCSHVQAVMIWRAGRLG